MVLLNSCVVLFTFNGYSVFEVFLDPVVSDDSIRPQAVFGCDMDSILFVLSDHIHANIWIAAHRVDALSALSDFAGLDVGMRASLDLDSWAFDM